MGTLHFKYKLSQILKERGITLEELSKASGVSVASLKKYTSIERHNTKGELTGGLNISSWSSPRAEVLERLSIALGVSMDELYKDETPYGY